MITYIGIGANLGNLHATVNDAIVRIGKIRDTRLINYSSKYRTAPIDATGDDYVNAVACVDTNLSAVDLLNELHLIEHAHGRERAYRNAPRTLDLDILLYGDERIDLPSLHIPHPRMLDRAFVLVPLLEIAPNIIIPTRGLARNHMAAVSGQAITRIV